MPKDKPNTQATIGNVTSTHPFTQRDLEAGETIYGTHPAKQASIAASSAYNAMQEFKNAQTNFGANYQGNLSQSSSNIKPTASVGLPTVNVQTFDSGSYTNPQRTTDSSANDNSSSIDTYSFLDDAQRVADWKERNPNKNAFGFNKRNLPSLDARYKKALNDGKTAKAGRIKNKMDNFKQNQKDRSGNATFLDKINPKNWL